MPVHLLMCFRAYIPLYHGLHTCCYVLGSTHLLYFRVYTPTVFQGLHTCCYISGPTHECVNNIIQLLLYMFQGLYTCYISGSTLLLCFRAYTPAAIFQGLHTCYYISGSAHLLLDFRVYTPAAIFQGLHTSVSITLYNSLILKIKNYTRKQSE